MEKTLKNLIPPSKGFKSFYFKQKDNTLFNTIFEKWYGIGYWGNIDKDKIKDQQYSWYKKLKGMIKENDYDSLLMSMGNRDNKVTRDMFTKITNVNVKKDNITDIKDKLRNFCLKQIKETINKNKLNADEST